MMRWHLTGLLALGAVIGAAIVGHLYAGNRWAAAVTAGGLAGALFCNFMADSLRHRAAEIAKRSENES